MARDNYIVINDFYKTQLKKEEKSLVQMESMGWKKDHPNIIHCKILIPYLKSKVREDI